MLNRISDAGNTCDYCSVSMPPKYNKVVELSGNGMSIRFCDGCFIKMTKEYEYLDSDECRIEDAASEAIRKFHLKGAKKGAVINLEDQPVKYKQDAVTLWSKLSTFGYETQIINEDGDIHVEFKVL